MQNKWVIVKKEKSTEINQKTHLKKKGIQTMLWCFSSGAIYQY